MQTQTRHLHSPPFFFLPFRPVLVQTYCLLHSVRKEQVTRKRKHATSIVRPSFSCPYPNIRLPLPPTPSEAPPAGWVTPDPQPFWPSRDSSYLFTMSQPFFHSTARHITSLAPPFNSSCIPEIHAHLPAARPTNTPPRYTAPRPSQDPAEMVPKISFNSFTADSQNHATRDPHTPLASIYLQVHWEMQLLNPNPAYVFDGSKPERYFSWLDSFSKLISKAGCEDSYDEILLYLRPHLAGEALNIYSSFADIPIATPHVTLIKILEALHDRYGSADVLARRLDIAVSELPFVSNQENDESIAQIHALLVVARQIRFINFKIPGLLHEFYTLSGISKLSRKMPREFQIQWRSFYIAKKEAREPQPTMVEFVDKVERYLREISEPLPSDDPTRCYTPARAMKHNDISPNNTKTPQNFKEASSPRTLPSTCPLHIDPRCHSLLECPLFLTATVEVRLEYLRNQRRCIQCSNLHLSGECTSSVVCLSCNGNHDSILCDNFCRKSLIQDPPLSKTCNDVVSLSHTTQSVLQGPVARPNSSSRSPDGLRLYPTAAAGASLLTGVNLHRWSSTDYSCRADFSSETPPFVGDSNPIPPQNNKPDFRKVSDVLIHNPTTATDTFRASKLCDTPDFSSYDPPRALDVLDSTGSPDTYQSLHRKIMDPYIPEALTPYHTNTFTCTNIGFYKPDYTALPAPPRASPALTSYIKYLPSGFPHHRKALLPPPMVIWPPSVPPEPPPVPPEPPPTPPDRPPVRSQFPRRIPNLRV